MLVAARLAPTAHYARRPLHTAALLRYSLGILDGSRRYRCLGSLDWYRQARRRRPAAAVGYYALHRRRIRLDILCRRAGMTMLRPGVWCDNVADVLYAGYGARDWRQR